VWLRTDEARVFIALQPHFRIMTFARPDQPTVMAGGEMRFHGIRLAVMDPDQVKHSFAVGNKPAEIVNRDAHSVSVQLQPAHGLRYHVRVALDPQHARLTATYRLENVDTQPRTVSCWSLISYAKQGHMIAPFGVKEGERRRLVLHGYEQWPQPSMQFGQSALLIDTAGEMVGRSWKMGLITPPGWVAFVRDRDVLLSRVPFDPQATYPEDGANITMYADIWCETEHVGPLETLEPGESTQITETLDLLTLSDDLAVDDPDAARKQIEQLIPQLDAPDEQ
jgi:hypothetical protein